ncbi:hypothetical protein Q7P37_001193 [Cladosporium fusiforme]
MSAIHNLVHQFLEIPKNERGDVLEELTSYLSTHDISGVLAAVSDRWDPFRKLPVELVIRIFDYLHPFDVWSKRLVNRQWNKTLSSDSVFRAARARMADHDPTDCGLPPTPELDLSPIDEIRHIQSLRLGRPFSSTLIQENLAFAIHDCRLPTFELKGRHIAYLHGTPGQSNTVVVRDLPSGSISQLSGEAREKISGFTLTSEILVFTTFTGVLYVASLNSLPATRRATRLPSSLVWSLAGDQSVAACLFRGDSDHTIVIHHASSASTTSFCVRGQDLPQGNMPTLVESLLVNAARQTIDLLVLVSERLKDIECRTKIGVIRFSFSGNILSRHVSPQGEIYYEEDVFWRRDDADKLVPRPTQTNNLGLGNLRPAGRKGLYQTTQQFWARETLLYDAETLSFTHLPNLPYCEPPARYVNESAMWKGFRYLLMATSSGKQEQEIFMKLLQPYDMTNLPTPPNETEQDPLDAADPSFQTEYLPRWCGSHVAWELLVPAHPRPSLNDPQPGDQYTFVAMNDSFAVLVLPEHDIIHVLCFDERIHMHGYQTTELWERYGKQGFFERRQARRLEYPEVPGIGFALAEKCDAERNLFGRENKCQSRPRTEWKMPFFDSYYESEECDDAEVAGSGR